MLEGSWRMPQTIIWALIGNLYSAMTFYAFNDIEILIRSLKLTKPWIIASITPLKLKPPKLCKWFYKNHIKALPLTWRMGENRTSRYFTPSFTASSQTSYITRVMASNNTLLTCINLFVILSWKKKKSLTSSL